jgi:hypothetical protein
MIELEAEAERQSLLYARRARFYSSLYYIFGLPAAILAAIAGATALASTTGRFAAGIIALTSSALSAAVIFLDSGKQRDRAAQARTYWDDLYNEIHVARLTKLSGYDVESGPRALSSFYTAASSIRAGRNPADHVAQRVVRRSSSGDGPLRSLFPPTVTNVSPPGGPAAGGDIVVVTGIGFTNATGVSFGAVAALNLAVASDTQLTVTSPPVTAAGPVDVTVTNSAGFSAITPADQFIYAEAPTVTSVDPPNGPTAGGSTVKVTGIGFTNATGVSFGTVAALNLAIASDTQLTVTSPPGTGGRCVDVTVTNSAGTSAGTPGDQFTYI